MEPVDSDSVVAMVGVGRVETWIGAGAMKSLSSAEVEEPEDRALTRTEPNARHVPGVNPAAISALERLTEASPNSPLPTLALPLRTSEMAAALTPASAKPCAERSCWSP